jgi:hypothetical protein
VSKDSVFANKFRFGDGGLLMVQVTYLPSVCSGVTEICHKALPAHALRAVKDNLKSVSNEGHFTLEAKTFSFASPLVLLWGH